MLRIFTYSLSAYLNNDNNNNRNVIFICNVIFWKYCRYRSAYCSSALGQVAAESTAHVLLSRNTFDSTILGLFLYSLHVEVLFLHVLLKSVHLLSFVTSFASGAALTTQ